MGQPGPDLAAQGGAVSHSLAPTSNMEERGHGLAPTQLHGAWEVGSIDCHCSPTTIFPDPWGALWAGCHGSVGQIWPAGGGLSIPVLKHE